MRAASSDPGAARPASPGAPDSLAVDCPDAVQGEPAMGEFPEDAAEMRRSGYAVVDAIVDRWASLGEQPVWQGGGREVVQALPDDPPTECGRDLDELLGILTDGVLPLSARVDHPRFLAFIPSSPTWASVLGSFLVSGHNVFQGTWLEAAGPSWIELVVLDWFRQWLGFPASGGGLLTSGGSAANLMAIVAAREAAGNPERGAIYASDQVHSSVVRGARIAGIGADRVRLLSTGGDGSISTAEVVRAIRRDRDAGFQPFCLVANAGTTNTGAIDPLRECARIAESEGMWHHIDGAYGGFAVLDRASRPLLDGIELADSVTLDPHKWLYQPYETGCLLVRDANRLSETFRILPDYLQDADRGPDEINFCDRGLQLTRSFRALYIWLSVQRYGLAAHRSAIARTIALARRAEGWIRSSTDLEILAPQSLGIVCFRYRGRGRERPDPAGPDPMRRDQAAGDREGRDLDDLNRRIQEEIVSSGRAMISSTRVGGCFSLRFCILNYRTTEEDVVEILERIVATGRRLEGA